ncbi:MAG: beta-lactamase family protein [Flavobacteriales bacterium]|nr:MAG: beta-lactamase family protein [Flavobacteriales bacterium]
MKYNHTLAFTLALIGSMGGQAIGQVATSDLFGRTPFRELAATWPGVMNAVHVQGMVVGVIHGDSISTHALGYCDAEARTPPSTNSPAYIASVTKVFVAQAIMQLAQDGKVDLDAPVRTYLPRFRLADSTASATITIRDLLAHRKGLESWAITFGEAYTGQMNDERYYRLLSQVEPGSEFSYSNLHYTLLGKVIESVTGLSWKQYVEDRVFAPSVMRSTHAAVATLADSRAMRPLEHGLDGYRMPDERKTDRTMHAAGGVVSTCEDLLRWLHMHMHDGRDANGPVISGIVVRSMYESQVALPEEHPFIPGQSRTGWGLGWMLREHRGATFVVHNGLFAGAAAFIGFLPKERIGVVVLANAKEPGMWMCETVVAQLLDRLLGLSTQSYQDPLPPWFAAAAGEPVEEPKSKDGVGTTLPGSAYDGRFSNADWGELDVTFDGHELRLRIGDLPLPLEWTGADTFIAGGDHEGSFMLQKGQVVAVELGMPLPDKARFTRAR